MSKLYPPYIESTLPAFMGTSLTVSFQMNEGVGNGEITGFYLNIKSIYTNRNLFSNPVFSGNYDLENGTVTFALPSELSIGEFYKVQLAYQDKENKEEGYYSTVGIIKYTAKPILSIDKTKIGQLSLIQSTYCGIYQQEKDPTEKVYSYYFIIRDNKGNVIDSSGELIHNHGNDLESSSSTDLYKIKRTLKDNQIYTIEYGITTINGLQCSTPQYRIMHYNTIDSDLQDVILKSEINEDNGYIKVFLQSTKEENPRITGDFLMCRCSSEDNFELWTEVQRFHVRENTLDNFVWKDYSIKQGETYQYSIQQYSDNVISNRLVSEEKILATFEDMFLSDGERQLRIRFNPKVSSFKSTLLEQKQNTLGEQFPFFYRNGIVNYKEFPISGLISYLMDENEDFFSEEELGLDKETSKIRTTNLVDYNITAERQFKLEVLDWLNDGQPKLFRSPTEGNYIVRLMNTSLSPNETLGRMLHTFSTTATEIAEYNIENLYEYNFIKVGDINIDEVQFSTVMISELDKERKFSELQNQNNIIYLDCQDFIPGSSIIIVYSNMEKEKIIFGVTGSYKIKFDEPIEDLIVPEKTIQGQINLGYYSNKIAPFNNITNIEVSDLIAVQVHGTQTTDNFNELSEKKDDVVSLYSVQELSSNEVITKETKIVKYNFLHFEKGVLPTETSSPCYKIKIGDEIIDLNYIENYEINDLEYNNVPKIWLGDGVWLNSSLQRRTYSYKK